MGRTHRHNGGYKCLWWSLSHLNLFFCLFQRTRDNHPEINIFPLLKHVSNKRIVEQNKALHTGLKCWSNKYKQTKYQDYFSPLCFSKERGNEQTTTCNLQAEVFLWQPTDQLNSLQISFDVLMWERPSSPYVSKDSSWFPGGLQAGLSLLLCCALIQITQKEGNTQKSNLETDCSWWWLLFSLCFLPSC